MESIRAFTQDPAIYCLPVGPALCVLMGMEAIPIHVISIECIDGTDKAFGDFSQLGFHFLVLFFLQVYHEKFSRRSDRRMSALQAKLYRIVPKSRTS